MDKYVTYGGLRLLPNWEKLHRRCYFCGANQSVKYAMSTYNPATEALGSFFICNKCAMRVIQKELRSSNAEKENEKC